MSNAHVDAPNASVNLPPAAGSIGLHDCVTMGKPLSVNRQGPNGDDSEKAVSRRDWRNPVLRGFGWG